MENHCPNQNGAPIRLVIPWKYGFKALNQLLKSNLPRSNLQQAGTLVHLRNMDFTQT